VSRQSSKLSAILAAVLTISWAYVLALALVYADAYRS
jgi:hypothetical protein